MVTCKLSTQLPCLKVKHLLCTYLEDMFQDIDSKLKLRRRIQELRHTKTVQKYANAFQIYQLKLGGAHLDDSAATF